MKTTSPDALCIIPARGGSKRLPRKNLLPLAGKPLLGYTLEAALESGKFRDVVVSSDDDEILDLTRSYSAVADRRTPELSGDMIRMVQVVEEYLGRDGVSGQYERVSVLLPTCPFRLASDVIGAFELHDRHRDAILVSVCEYDFPPQLAMEFAEDGVQLIKTDPEAYSTTTRSQSIPKAYHPNGAIYLCGVDTFLEKRTFFAEPSVGYLMPPQRSFDIDYPYQFRIADAMMQDLHDQSLDS